MSWAARAAVPSLLLVGLAGTIALLFGRAVRTRPQAATGASNFDVLAVERSLLGPLTRAVMPAAAAAGIDPWVVAFVAAVACNWFIVPSQSTVFLPLRASAGHLFSFRQARVFALAYAGVLLIALCAAVPVWQLMGLLP